jgi:type VI secretion system protein ImpC
MQFNLSLSREPVARTPHRGPLRLLVMGDFSGLTAAPKAALAVRPTHRVDLDNLDDVMRRLAPRVNLPVGEVDFESLDDFHPDALFNRLDVFRALRDMRRRLLDPNSFAQAAAELRQDAAPGAPSAAPGGADGGLLAQLLGGQPVAAPPAPAPATGIDALIRQIVAPHIVPDIAPQQATYLASVDAAIAEQMRTLLHAPAFQALESAWRGVQWLISSLELDEDLQLHLFDVSRDELLADVVASQGRLGQTGLHLALADRWRNVPGGEGWTALVGLYRFGPSDADIGLLAALGLIASQAGGPLLAAGDTTLATADPATLAGWQALRGSEAAPWIGLAAPRVLLRLPYGKASDPIVSFAFEEVIGVPEHEQLLWGNGGLAAALLIGRAFSARGWRFEPGDEREIGDLPAYTYLKDGERELQACAEHYLGEQGGNALLAAGLMPVMSHRHANAVTVMRFQSVAQPPRALAGLAAGTA